MPRSPCNSTAAAPSIRRRRTCRRRSTRRPASCRPTMPNPPDLPEDQPGRYACPDAGADLGDTAAHHGQRLRQQHPGAEDFANARRRPCRHRRTAEPGDPGPGQPGAARRTGLDLEAVRTALATATVDQPKGTLYGANQAFALQTNDQLMTAEGFNDYILAYRSGLRHADRCGSAMSAGRSLRRKMYDWRVG